MDYKFIIYAMLLCVLVLGISYSCKEDTKVIIEKEREIVYDTVYIKVQLPPITIRDTAQAIIKYKDNPVDELLLAEVCQLRAERDSINVKLSKYISEEIRIDTIAGMDTVRFWIDLYTLRYSLDIRHSVVELPSVTEYHTVYLDNRNDKYYAGAIGYGAGAFSVLLYLLVK